MLSNDSDQKKMKSLSLTVQTPLWKVHWPETCWIQLGADLPSHALYYLPSSLQQSPSHAHVPKDYSGCQHYCLFWWWHLEGPYQQLTTDTLGWWDRQMGKSKRGGNKDSLRWPELLQSRQHVQDKARTSVLPLSNTLNTRQRHLSEEPQCRRDRCCSVKLGYWESRLEMNSEQQVICIIFWS